MESCPKNKSLSVKGAEREREEEEGFRSFAEWGVKRQYSNRVVRKSGAQKDEKEEDK